MPRYKVKVTEKRVDYVWLDAPNADTAKARAPRYSECKIFSPSYECEVVERILKKTD